MAAHALLDIHDTVAAHPLGKPLDGRDRYGMTPEQARIYRWLVANRPHDEAFTVDYRAAGADLGISCGTVHFCTTALIERGWIEPVGAHGHYRLVAPVMRFGGSQA